ncbi:unnamed protein product [Urochloa decumbens]|uniref:CCHC-type domain-containing protein n=1 Tax=Urochloa decumbens TaxID=240449 RepID=A0ABC9EKP3_9POAL
MGFRAEGRPFYSSSSRRAVPSSSSLSKAQMEQRNAFKKWAQGRCYRCLARDHQVRSCRDFFRCIRCRQAGHGERQCPFRPPPATPCFHSTAANPHHPQHAQRWADAAAMSPSRGPHVSFPASTNLDPMGAMDIMPCAACGCCCRATHDSPMQDLQSMLRPLLESLRSELHDFFISRLEEVVCPLKSEASIIRLWLARMTNHLEHVESCKDPSASDLVDLFGPCSPVQRSSTPPSFTSLADDCTPRDSMPHDEQCVDTTAADVGQQTTNVCELQTIKKTVQEPSAHCSLNDQSATVPPATIEAATVPAGCEEPDKACDCVKQSPLDLPIEQRMLQVATSIEDVVIVEDASDDEEASLAMDPTVGDVVELFIGSDGSAQCEVEAERPDDPPMEAPFLTYVAATKIEEPRVVTPVEDIVLVEDASDVDEDAAASNVVDCPTLSLVDATIEEPLSPRPQLMTTTTRHKRKSFDRTSLRRSACLAQRNTLRNLGIIGHDGKFDEDVIQGYANYLKEVLPPDLLSSLMLVKGRVFWDLVARISSSLG